MTTPNNTPTQNKDPPIAFGKFNPTQKQLPLRDFERAFKITSRYGPNQWQSQLQSIDNLLKHLKRYSQSQASRDTYLRHIKQYTDQTGISPDQLVKQPKHIAEQQIQNMIDNLQRQDKSRKYLNTVLKRLKTFYRVNGYTGTNTLQIQSIYEPTRYQKRLEYIPTKNEVHEMANNAGSPRDRAIILGLWSSGLRISTFCALNIGDIQQELEAGASLLKVEVYPEMRTRVPEACKNLVPYYTYFSTDTTQALKTYLDERVEKLGKVEPGYPLFNSNWHLYNLNQRNMMRLNRRTIGLLIKKAAKHAGIPKWKHISPHTLRKAFESILRSPLIDGSRMDNSTQQFLFGHILPGSQDTCYDKTKDEYHRSEYLKLDFTVDARRGGVVDKLVSVSELSGLFEEGWVFVSELGEGQVVVRKTG